MSPIISPSGGGGGGSGQGFSVATFSLTAAQLKATVVTPQTVIAAPGANKVLVPVAGTLVYTFATTAYPSYVQAVFYISSTSQPIGGVTSFLNQTANTVCGVGVFYSPNDVFPRATFANAPMLLDAFDLGGPILTTSLANGGAGYAVNDTGTVADNISHGTGATYRVLTVDGGGAVLTYTITGAGSGYVAQSGTTTAVGGGQPGVGAGFTLNILTISPSNDPGDGALAGTIYYVTANV